MDFAGPIQALPVLYDRHHPMYLLSEKCFGADEIDFRQELVGVEDVADEGPNLRGELRQDTDDLTSLFGLQFADTVVRLDHYLWFDENCLSRSRLVVDDAFNLPLESRSHRYHQTTVAHRRCHILIYYALGLCRPEDRLEVAGDAAHRGGHLATDLEEAVGRAIFHLAELVEQSIDAPN